MLSLIFFIKTKGLRSSVLPLENVAFLHALLVSADVSARHAVPGPRAPAPLG